MPVKCEYCQGACVDGATRCPACGAPLDADPPPPDHRVCPFCRRRLLALGSPACNYCGRALPESYIKMRQATLRRIDAARTPEERAEIERDADDTFKQVLKSLFTLDDLSREGRQK